MPMQYKTPRVAGAAHTAVKVQAGKGPAAKPNTKSHPLGLPKKVTGDPHTLMAVDPKSTNRVPPMGGPGIFGAGVGKNGASNAMTQELVNTGVAGSPQRVDYKKRQNSDAGGGKA